MSHPSIDIPNLLYRYANHIDAGEFKAAAQLFEHGCVEVDGHEITNPQHIIQMWKDWIFLYDGQPLTRHITTNPIIELSKDKQKASCQSQWTVLQATKNLALQPIATGRYEDDFERVDGEWRFTKRRYAGIDLIGDMSQHTRKPVNTTDG